MTIIFKNSTVRNKKPLATDFEDNAKLCINAADGIIYTTKLDENGNRVVVSSTQAFEDSITPVAEPGKLIKVNDNGKLSVSISGNAISLEGLSLTVNQLNSLLDSEGKFNSVLMPGSVDEILEFPNLQSFPVTGSKSFMYLALDTGNLYRWSGTVYAEIATGDFVKTIGSLKGNISASQLKTELSLENVDNTKDADKNVKTATKLTTARNLTIGSSTKTFDGSSNFSVSQLEFLGLATAPNDGDLLQWNAAQSKFVAISILDGGSY